MAVLLNRRGLLRAGAGTAGLASLGGMAFSATAAETSPLLILVNLRGGMDGLHALSPADDASFVEKRPPELRSLAAGTDQGHRLDADPAVDFRLHPRAAALAELWRGGRLALWPAAGLPEPTRSHFEAQDMLGLGIGLRREAAARGPGWLARWAEAVDARRQPPSPIAALAAQDSMPAELRGMGRAVAVPTTNGGLAPPGGAFGAGLLQALYQSAPGPVGAAGRQALAALHSLDQGLPRGPGGEWLPYVPKPGVTYGPAREFGRGLAVVAQVAKLQPRLVAATVDLGGWDTHDGQAWRMRDRMGLLDSGLAALDRDLDGLGRPWVVLVASEFGRRLRANRSGGTDHGRAGLVLAFGSADCGLHRHFGPWPGLAPEALEDGADLRVATDYRQAFAAVLATLLPGGPAPFRQA